MSLSPAELSMRARIGAYSLHALRDPRETTAAARAAFLARFEEQVDPDRSLPEAERLRRAEAARSAHFARLALKRSRRRSTRAQAGKTTTAGAQSAVVEVEAEVHSGVGHEQLQPA